MRLVIEQGELAGLEFALERPVIIVGRGKQSDLILQDHGISRQHARLQHGPQGWMLTDLGSTNGTLLNGQPIRAQEPHLLRPGDRVTIGDSVLSLQELPKEGLAPQSRQRTRPHPALLAAGALLLVIVLTGIVALLMIVLQPKEEMTTPEPLDPLEGIGTVPPIATALKDLVAGTVALTDLPVPTQLEEIATALPVSTQLEDLATALPVPTELREIATSIVPSVPIELPGFPEVATSTPAPVSAALLQNAVHATSFGDGAGAGP